MKIYDGSGGGAAIEEVRQRRRIRRRSVGVADFAITEDDTALVTSGLGSCVAVGVTDAVNAAGLVHVMLPSTDGRPMNNPAKFADTGIGVLVEALEAADADRRGLSAKIAGGSEMIAFTNQGASIGDRNVEAVRETLSAEAIPITAEDVGGDEGRTVEFTLAGDLVVRTARGGERTL